MKKRAKDIFLAILIIVAYLLSNIFKIIPIIVFNIDYDNLNIIIKMIYNLGFEILFILMIFLIYKKEMLNDTKNFFKNLKEYFLKYIPYWFLMIVLMYISNFIIIYFAGNIAKNEEAVRSLVDNYPIYTIILSVLIAPLLEELIFRKCIYKIFNQKIIYILFSGLFFGFMHILGNVSNFYDVLYIIPYSIPGFIFAYIYTESKNIFSTIGIHTMHNGILIALQFLI